MRNVIVTIFIILLTFAQHGNLLADEEFITISGSVENKSSGSNSSKEYSIKLFKIEDISGEIIEISKTKTVKSQFFLTNVSVNTDDQLFLVTENEGLSVITDLIATEKWDDLIITIYDRETSLENITFTEYSLMIPQINLHENKISVLGLITMTNIGDKTFQADISNPNLTGFDLLRFSLPEGYSELNVDSDLPSGTVMEIPTGFALSNPVPPGTYQIIFSYTSILDNSSFSFKLKFPFGADKVRILMNAPSGAIKGNGLSSVEKIKIDQDYYTISEGTNYEKGSFIDLNLSSFPKTQGVNSIFLFFETNLYKIILITVISLALFLLIIYSIFANFKNKNKQDSSKEKERLILKIKRLNESFKSGKIREEEYQILEQGFKEKLTRL